jgi:hypothetical protein
MIENDPQKLKLKLIILNYGGVINELNFAFHLSPRFLKRTFAPCFARLLTSSGHFIDY